MFELLLSRWDALWWTSCDLVWPRCSQGTTGKLVNLHEMWKSPLESRTFHSEEIHHMRVKGGPILKGGDGQLLFKNDQKESQLREQTESNIWDKKIETQSAFPLDLLSTAAPCRCGELPRPQARYRGRGHHDLGDGLPQGVLRHDHHNRLWIPGQP